ncbi:TPA: ATP-grasp fold amidoligase family protein, partial [Streptococcus suis]
RISFFDLDGRELDFYRSDYKRLENFVLPNNYLKMKKIAEKLAKVVDSPFVRIDLYSVNGKIYFSEITLSPCGGFLPFYPKSADIEVGKLLELNINNFNNEV